MMSAEAFALTNLVLWIVILAWLFIAERRGRRSFESTHRGIRYRRMDTAAALELIRIRHRAEWPTRRRSDIGQTRGPFENPD